MSNTSSMNDPYRSDIDLPSMDRVRYFIAVAEERHFGRAAARLGIAQPPLSQQISRLERSLGIRLFERTTRQVALTEAGQRFLDHARGALATLRDGIEAARLAAPGQTGQLRLGFPASLAHSPLPSVVRRFHQAFPDVDLQLHEMPTTAQLQALRRHQIDVAFLRDATPEDPELVV